MQVTQKSSLLSQYKTWEILIILFATYLPETEPGATHTPAVSAADKQAPPPGEDMVPCSLTLIMSLSLTVDIYQSNIVTPPEKIIKKVLSQSV